MIYGFFEKKLKDKLKYFNEFTVLVWSVQFLKFSVSTNIVI